MKWKSAGKKNRDDVYFDYSLFHLKDMCYDCSEAQEHTGLTPVTVILPELLALS